MARIAPLPYRVVLDDTGGQFSGWPSIDCEEEFDVTVIHRAGFKQEFWGDLSLKDAIKTADFIVTACNAHDQLVAALEGLVEIIDKAGLINLSNGVQLGQTVWYVKATDRLEFARQALAAAGETKE